MDRLRARHARVHVAVGHSKPRLSACSNGTFSNRTNAAACEAHTVCATLRSRRSRARPRWTPSASRGPTAGQARTYMSPSATANRVCSACSNGTFSNRTNAAACEAHTVCADASFASLKGTASMDTICQPWTDCGPGTHVYMSPSATANRACAACGTGQYSNVTNGATCSSCARVCGNGTRARSCGGPSATIVASRPRHVGQRLGVRVLSARRSRRQKCLGCDDCVQGRYQNKEKKISCRGCPPGVGIAVGGASSREACEACAAGTIAPSSGSTSCQACAIGKVQSRVGQAECSDCPAGSYQTAPGETHCRECPDGKYTNGTATAGVLCLACQAGWYGNTNRSTNSTRGTAYAAFTTPKTSTSHCCDCPPTFYQPDQGAHSCRKCRADRVCPAQSTFEGVCNGNEFVVKETQTCRGCPRIGPDREATCGSGKLIMQNGFFSSESFAEQAQGRTSVSNMTLFTRCPCPDCCVVVTTAAQCSVITARPARCAPSARRAHRYHWQLDDMRVKCLQESMGDFLKGQTLQFVTVGLVVLLCTVFVAMDVRSEWISPPGAEVPAGLQRRFVSKSKIVVNFGQIVTLSKRCTP